MISSNCCCTENHSSAFRPRDFNAVHENASEDENALVRGNGDDNINHNESYTSVRIQGLPSSRQTNHPCEFHESGVGFGGISFNAKCMAHNRNRRRNLWSHVFVMIGVLMVLIGVVEGFGFPIGGDRTGAKIPFVANRCFLPFQHATINSTNKSSKSSKNQQRHQMAINDDDEEQNENNNDDEFLNGLKFRAEKLRLEEANKRRFLKARARHLPYEECRLWVQAWGNRWISEQEWREWIDMGEKRNAYIPARPDEYYGRLGKWISWEHFLGVADVDTGEEVDADGAGNGGGNITIVDGTFD